MSGDPIGYPWSHACCNCTGHSSWSSGWVTTTAAVPPVYSLTERKLSDDDIERIAKRVAELLKAEK